MGRLSPGKQRPQSSPDTGLNQLHRLVSPAHKGIERETEVGRVMFEAFRSILKLKEEPSIARLGRIRQMGAASSVAESNKLRHNRLMHTMDVVRNVLQLASHGNFSPRMTALCAAVAFAHDIAHLPTSHLLERTLINHLGINRNHDAMRIPRLLNTTIRSRLEPALHRFGATYDELLAAMVEPDISNTRASLDDMGKRGVVVKDSLAFLRRLETDVSLKHRGASINLLVDDLVDLASYVQRDLYRAHAVQQPMQITDQLVAEVSHASDWVLNSVRTTESTGSPHPFEVTALVPMLQLLAARGYLYQTISCSPVATVLSKQFSASLEEYLQTSIDQDARIQGLEQMTDEDLFCAIPSGAGFRAGITGLGDAILDVITIPSNAPAIIEQYLEDARATLTSPSLSIVLVPPFCKTLTMPISQEAVSEALKLTVRERSAQFHPRELLRGIPPEFDSRFYLELVIDESASTATVRTVSQPAVAVVYDGSDKSKDEGITRQVAEARRALVAGWRYE